MLKIIDKNIEKNAESSDERGSARMTFMCDDISDLPEFDSMQTHDISMGSMAYVIRQGKTYLMDSKHIWYSTDGATN